MGGEWPFDIELRRRVTPQQLREWALIEVKYSHGDAMVTRSASLVRSTAASPKVPTSLPSAIAPAGLPIHRPVAPSGQDAGPPEPSR